MPRRRAAVAALASAALGLGAPVAPAEDLPMGWRQGLMETHRYTMEVGGEVKGEIQQRLYGETAAGRKLYRLVYEVIRSMEMAPGVEVTGQMNMEVTFEPATFDLIQRVDHYAGGEVEGQVKYTRIPGGIRVRNEGSYQGIPRETEEKDFLYRVDGPLIDHVIFTHYIRSLPMKDGHTFEVETVNPTIQEVNQTKGLVRGVETMQWHGQQVQVRRVETATPVGVSTYYVGIGEDRLLYRYVSHRGETYLLQPPSGSPSG